MKVIFDICVIPTLPKIVLNYNGNGFKRSYEKKKMKNDIMLKYTIHIITLVFWSLQWNIHEYLGSTTESPE